MATFFINDKPYKCTNNMRLLTFLRDELRLTSVKNGCSEGACGTCMVLVDGNAVKACVQWTDRLEGKRIVTVEGLSERERQAYVRAFAQAGAVQCGFCTPGMVISAKALLDKVSNPTENEIRQAIRNNICRCTGYQKIVEGIKLAAELLATAEFSEDAAHTVSGIGRSLDRVDVAPKVLGTAVYSDDLFFPGMLYGGAIRSAYPRAVVKKIDVSGLKSVGGVVAVMTAKDLPGVKKIGHLKKDWDVLIGEGDVTHYLGDALVLVAATSKQALANALAATKNATDGSAVIEYVILTPVTSAAEGLSGKALVHPYTTDSNILFEQILKRGDVDKAFAEAAHIVTATYSTPPTEHAFLEPETAVACPDGDGGVIIYCGDQGIYQTQRECAAALGLPVEKVRVVAQTVGGGFGGKEDISLQHHTAILAYVTGKPVKMSLSRAESLLVHPKRHAMDMSFTLACDKNGLLTGLRAEILSDTGAYASLGGPVLQRACTHAAGPYNYHNIDITGRAVYTNNPPAGAFRGFGVTQSCFALESTLDLLAEAVGISPWDIRYINAIRPGQTLPNGQIADEGTALVETLEAVKSFYKSEPYAGIACAIKNSGLGVGVPDVGRCRLFVEDGTVYIRTSAACIGQGLGTVLTQIVSEVTELPPELIVHQNPDTGIAPDSGNTTASRQTVFTGEAARRAADELKRAMAGKPLTREGLRQMERESNEPLNFIGEFAFKTDKIGSDKENPVSHIAYSYATHVVALDGGGRLKRVVAAHDIGRAVNPKAIEGQIEGGVTMSLGYALTEDYPLDNCVPTAKFATLGLFKAPDVPEVQSVLIEKNVSGAAFGAKGIGEISSIPTPAAVAGAYRKLDGKDRRTLPLDGTPYSRKSNGKNGENDY